MEIYNLVCLCVLLKIYTRRLQGGRREDEKGGVSFAKALTGICSLTVW